MHRAREDSSCNCPHFAIVSPSSVTLNLPLHDLVNGGILSLKLSLSLSTACSCCPRVLLNIHAKKKTRVRTYLARWVVGHLLIQYVKFICLARCNTNSVAARKYFERQSFLPFHPHSPRWTFLFSFFYYYSKLRLKVWGFFDVRRPEYNGLNARIAK